MTDVMHAGRKLDESGLEQLLAGLTAVRGGDFSTRLPDSGDPLMGEIATVFNGMADQLDLFTSEVTRVAREVGTEGRLGGQADVKGVSGTWKDLTDSVERHGRQPHRAGPRRRPGGHRGGPGRPDARRSTVDAQAARSSSSRPR